MGQMLLVFWPISSHRKLIGLVKNSKAILNTFYLKSILLAKMKLLKLHVKVDTQEKPWEILEVTGMGRTFNFREEFTI